MPNNCTDDQFQELKLRFIYLFIYIIQICSGNTSGRMLDGDFLYIKILEVNSFAFDYRLFHEDFSPIKGALHDTQPICPAIYFLSE